MKLLILPALLALTFTAAADPVGSTFTYQGRLDHNGAPANGVFDLKFELYDAPADGNAIGAPVELPAQSVGAGLFRAELDFGGPLVFDGTAYWIQMSAKTAEAEDYLLVPGRSPVRTMPYAIRAASVVDGAITGSALADGAVTAAKLAPAAVGLAQLNLPAPPEPGQVLSSDGVDLTWITPPAGGGGGGAGPSPWILSGVQPFMSWQDTASGRSATISSAGGSMYFRVPDATNTQTLTAGYADYNGIVTRGRLSVEGNDPFITWDDGGVRSTISTNNGVLYFRMPQGASTVTAGYIGATGFVVNVPSFFAPGGSGGEVRVGTPNGETGLTIVGANRADVRFDGSVLKLAAGPGSNVPGDGVFITTAGRTGIGTTAPATKLDVAGDATATRLVLRADPQAPTNAAVLCADANVTNFVPFNTATGMALNLVTRDATVRKLTITGGADLAEPFPMSHDGIEPGTVVVIDPQHPGKLRRSTGPCDRKVAGVVSGANGIEPGISLIQEDKLEAGENVALTGRVYVKADAASGAIEPGDLLTTSSTPGHAMKVTDHTAAQGAILGKAMTPLSEGTGFVLVLVTLQ